MTFHFLDSIRKCNFFDGNFRGAEMYFDIKIRAKILRFMVISEIGRLLMLKTKLIDPKFHM